MTSLPHPPQYSCGAALAGVFPGVIVSAGSGSTTAVDGMGYGNNDRSARDAGPLRNFLPYRLSLLAHHLSLPGADLCVTELRLTVQEWKVLSIVADSGPLTPVEIRRLGTQDKSTISWALKRLEARGFVIREKKIGDGRTFNVRIAPAGRAFYRSLQPKAQKRARQILAALNDAELEELRRLIEKIGTTDLP
ncbi:MAG: MarR family winged helix-turn-helix transcriptional regulator [Stellaceae bacterium]